MQYFFIIVLAGYYSLVVGKKVYCIVEYWTGTFPLQTGFNFDVCTFHLRS